MKKKSVKSVSMISAGILGGLACAVFGGIYGPITKYTPFWLILSRPEIHSVSGNLLLGNEQLKPVSPLIAAMTQKAWNADDMVYGLRALSDQAKEGKQVYYEVYSEEEREKDPQKNQVGLYCLHSDSEEKKPYVILFAGGGFSSVCTFSESLPVGAAFQKMGYTVFMGTYRIRDHFGEAQRPEILAEDVAQEIRFIHAHAEELHVDTDNYLIGGFSAGSCTAATWCDPVYGYAKYGIEKPAAYCSMYGIMREYIDRADVPAFIRFCKNDQYFQHDLPLVYKNALDAKKIPNDMKIVDCSHGFGLGTGTEAEGWPEEAEAFWKSQWK